MPMIEENPANHSADSGEFHFFRSIDRHLELPSFEIGGVEFALTKYMLLELVAVLIIAAIFIPVARRIRDGSVPKGKFTNAVEFILVFIRDMVARPTLGKDADRFLPYLWTVFLFILTCNLLGMVPFLGSPTAAIAVTAVLALLSFFLINAAGIMENGFVGYVSSYVPHVEADSGLLKILAPFIVVGMTVIEVLSLFIRCIVLAVRLFASMLAGHTVLFVLLLFIEITGMLTVPSHPDHEALGGFGSQLLFWTVTASSVTLTVALSVLELFIACLQAFVFTFLTSVFIGMAMHPEH